MAAEERKQPGCKYFVKAAPSKAKCQVCNMVLSMGSSRAVFFFSDDFSGKNQFLAMQVIGHSMMVISAFKNVG